MADGVVPQTMPHAAMSSPKGVSKAVSKDGDDVY
jgi:hypothetical protein